MLLVKITLKEVVQMVLPKKVFYVGLKVEAEDKDSALIMADMIIVRQYEQKGDIIEVIEALDFERLIKLAEGQGLIPIQSEAT